MSDGDVGLKKEMDDAFHTMKDNTQINNDEKQLKIAKLNMPANVVDFLMDHYGFFDLVELNTICFYIMKTLGHMEKDGFKFAVHKTLGGKVEAYELNIHDLIARFRIQLAKSLSENKLYDPEIKTEHKEKNEEDNV
jgi:hypothetical protein